MDEMKPLVVYTDDLVRKAERGNPQRAISLLKQRIAPYARVERTLQIVDYHYVRIVEPWVTVRIRGVSLFLPDTVGRDYPLIIHGNDVSGAMKMFAMAFLNPQAYFEQPRARIKVSAGKNRPERHYLVGPRDLLGADPK